MSVFLDRNNKLRGYFNDNWTFTSIAWDNIVFNEDKLSNFVTFKIVDSHSHQASMGNDRVFRYYGGVNVTLYTLAGKSDTEGYTLAEKVVSMFIGKTIQGICFNRPPQVNNIGINGKWFIIQVSCPFFFDIIP